MSSELACLTERPLAVLGSVSCWRFPIPALGKWNFYRMNSQVITGESPISLGRPTDHAQCKRCFAFKLCLCFQSSLEPLNCLKLFQSWPVWTHLIIAAQRIQLLLFRNVPPKLCFCIGKPGRLLIQLINAHSFLVSLLRCERTDSPI